MNRRRLRISWLEDDNEEPTPVEINVVAEEELGEGNLPVRLSRPRRGQEARRTVASAPRQLELVNG